MNKLRNIAKQVLGKNQVTRIRHLLGQQELQPSLKKQLLESFGQLLDNSRDLLDRVPEPGPNAPRVLLYPAIGRAISCLFDGLLAHALHLRGANSMVLVCDQVFDYCDARYISTEDQQRACDNCFGRSSTFFDAYELPLLHFSQYAAQDVDYEALLQSWLAEEEQHPLIDATYRDINIGNLAYSSTLRYLLIGTFDLSDPQTRHIFLRLLVHTAQLVDILENVFEQHKPDVVLQTHSLYILWGTMAEVCHKHDVTFYDYHFGFRANTLIFGKGENYQWTIIKESPDHWRDVPLSAEQEANIRDYMTHRELGGRDDLAFFRDLQQSPEQVREMLNLDPDRPVIGAFPNLGWDGAVLFRETAFPHLFDWALALVRYAEEHPELQVVFRSHPAEVQKTNKSLETVQDAIRRQYPTLPENVRVIGPEQPINSYALIRLLDAAAVYTSKIGFELAYRGIPTLVAGMAFYRNQGFTFDASTPEEFFAYLDDLPRLKAIHEREKFSDWALRFSYYFFFQKYIDVSFLRWKYQKEFSLNIESLEEVMPGVNHSMDVICDMLLKDRPTYLTLEEGEILQRDNKATV